MLLLSWSCDSGKLLTLTLIIVSCIIIICNKDNDNSKNCNKVHLLSVFGVLCQDLWVKTHVKPVPTLESHRIVENKNKRCIIAQSFSCNTALSKHFENEECFGQKILCLHSGDLLMYNNMTETFCFVMTFLLRYNHTRKGYRF